LLAVLLVALWAAAVQEVCVLEQPPLHLIQHTQLLSAQGGRLQQSVTATTAQILFLLLQPLRAAAQARVVLITELTVALEAVAAAIVVLMALAAQEHQDKVMLVEQPIVMAAGQNLLAVAVVVLVRSAQMLRGLQLAALEVLVLQTA
jgi:hypothetical protein